MWGVRCGRGFRNDLVDDALWGVDPASFGGEAGVRAHGAEYDAAGYLHVVNLLDDGIERGVNIFAAAGSKASGMGVAVDCGMVSQAVFAHDLARITPDEKVGFDFFAARVAADAALTGVAEKVWGGADFAVSDDLVDVHVFSSGARHICSTDVNLVINRCQVVKCDRRDQSRLQRRRNVELPSRVKQS
jgi:hypothetical protein